MSYVGISIRDAMDKINIHANGWYLPQVQRQYVWGARYESETYICLLMDSLYRRYPIGGLVLWETDLPVPYREFFNDYYPGQLAKQVDEGRWGAHKSLVYDGQQRIQTLRAVLYYTFNGKALCFDLLFDKDAAESDDTGFFFVDKGKPAPARAIKMTELSTLQCNSKEKVKLETKYLAGNDLTEDQQHIVRANICTLWDVFVERNIKSIAYFPVISNSDKEVNEIFFRLNTGGVALTQIELVLGKIKARYSDYEEKLWAISSDINRATGNGFEFTTADVLQFFYLLVFETIKVESDRVETKDVECFHKLLEGTSVVLREYFENYLWGTLKINHASIVRKRLAMLPAIIYLAHLKECGNAFQIKKFTAANLEKMHQYFILSQFGDWNTPTMVNKFAQEARKAGQAGMDFPLPAIKAIAIRKNRSDVLYYHQFLSQPWLAVKVLTPNRSYIFFDATPQVDHIFPLALEGADDNYKSRVDVLWNFQPLPAGVNNYKRARHPKEFFSSSEGAKYLSDYDFLPELNSDRWKDERAFLRYRHLRMRKELLKRYGLRLKRLRSKQQR